MSRAQARAARSRPWGDVPRGETKTGLVLVDKPAGVTSHDVVGALRRLAGTRAVGHAGTLDPMATGLLLVACGRATKLLRYLHGADKSYEATFFFGASSTTDDADGELTPVPFANVDAAAVDAALARLTGDIMQVPAAVSAIKVHGERAYDRVRRGENVYLDARPVHVARCERISAMTPMSVTDVGIDGISCHVAVDCSAGTYIRALARDAGTMVGSGAHLRALRRTRVGQWSVSEASTVTDLCRHVAAGQAVPAWSISDMCRALFPCLAITQEQARALSMGQFIDPPVQDLSSWPAAAYVDDRAVALVSPRGGKLKPDLQLTQ